MTATYRSKVDPPATGAVMSVDTLRLDELRAHVRVSGDLELSTGAPLRAVLHGHLAAGRRYLQLDLSSVGFLDASALSGIAEVHHAALKQRGTLLITGVSAHVARLLRLTGLDGVLFVGGPRAEDLRDAEPAGEDAPAKPTVWPARPVPWTPVAAGCAERPRRPG